MAKFYWGYTNPQAVLLYLKQSTLVRLHLVSLRFFPKRVIPFTIIDQYRCFCFWESPWYSDECTQRLHYIPYMSALGFVWFELNLLLSKNKGCQSGASLEMPPSSPSTKDIGLGNNK